MGLEQATTPMFAGHQTFHPRFGWIKKGFDAASANPNVFNEPNAPVTLGVGKNMAEAIRFWCMATKTLVRKPHPQRPRTSVFVPTSLGEALLGANGFDPYMEDPSTLWILHWQAIAFQSSLPVWWSTFNDLPAIEFGEDELVRFCVDEVAATTWNQPKESSIRKDVDCLLRMYTTRQTRHRQSVDEMLDSPFRELGIITPTQGGDLSYRFVRGRKPGMPSVAITYACLDFLALSDPNARTASMTRLTSDPGSPGRLMKLTEEAIVAAVEETARTIPGLALASPAGTTQLVIDESAEVLASTVLKSHHANRGIGHDFPPYAVAGVDARIAAHDAQMPIDLREVKTTPGLSR